MLAAAPGHIQVRHLGGVGAAPVAVVAGPYRFSQGAEASAEWHGNGKVVGPHRWPAAYDIV